ncbi:MAG: hypothetical protein PHH54_04035 [Candidatus Nanoarchaeia archaeon]|nr:hypothetical protein [Candidatus Nanoarchaeia archaeon]MDD5741129.1 hypothetical protein [Candidatus Nanoarchaeia archaeon]
MAKITAIVVTIIGILLILKELAILSVITDYNGWLIAIGVLIIGIAKLIRNFKK